MDYNCNRYSQGCRQQSRQQNNNMANASNDNNMTETPNCMPIGMCYVPWQRWGSVYEPCKALERGTLFPDLDKPFSGGCR